jgi:hypothetical protein
MSDQCRPVKSFLSTLIRSFSWTCIRRREARCRFSLQDGSKIKYEEAERDRNDRLRLAELDQLHAIFRIFAIICEVNPSVSIAAL